MTSSCDVSVGCNYLSLPLIPASGTTLLNCQYRVREIPMKCWQWYDCVNLSIFGKSQAKTTEAMDSFKPSFYYHKHVWYHTTGALCPICACKSLIFYQHLIGCLHSRYQSSSGIVKNSVAAGGALVWFSSPELAESGGHVVELTLQFLMLSSQTIAPGHGTSS